MQQVARTLHSLDRQRRFTKDQDSRKAVLALMETVRHAYVSGTIPGSPRLLLHLLSYYKESGHLHQGIELWKWLSKADDAVLSPIYVGAAIELLAVYGAGIHYCEEVYERTIDQQANINSQYHLTPGAIFSDRSKPIMIKNTSLGLLQGILTARLFYSKWQSALLTLDTAFRLQPSQLVPRILDLFVYERPIFEALPVFFMYCRGGNTISSVTFTVLLRSIRSLADSTSHHETRVALVRAMFHSVEAYVGSAGALSTQHLNILTSAMVATMPQSPGAVTDALTKTDNESTTRGMSVLSGVIEYFARKGAPADRKTVSGLIAAAVPLGQLGLAKQVAYSMTDEDHPPDENAAQSLMIAAMVLKDADFLKTAWESLCSSSMSDRQNVPSLRSWRVFVLAARKCDLESSVTTYSERLLGENHPHIRAGIDATEEVSMTQYHFLAEESRPPELNHIASFRELCNHVLSRLDRMRNTQQSVYRNFQEYPLEGLTVFDWPEVAEEGWQRRLYDELTLNKDIQTSQPSPTEPSGTHEIALPAISNTGIQFDRLRYLNWKSINQLLMLAESCQEKLEMSTDAAIKERRAIAEQRRPSRAGGSQGPRFAVTADQFEAYRRDVETERVKQSTEEEWRTRVLKLRDPDYETPHKTRNTDVETSP
ncbi:MAG: hypothetical protein Q9222_000648 [Ikaeria aurantiellina]